MPDKELRYVTRGELTCDQTIRMLTGVTNTFKRKRMIWYSCIFAMCLLLALLEGVALASWIPMLWCVMVAGLFLLSVLMMKYVQKKQKQSFMEQYPEGMLAYENGFAEDGIHIHNLINGARSIMAYSVLKKLTQVDEFWALSSKAGVCVPLFPAQLSETDRKSLLALLQEKNPKIKIKVK